MSLRDDLKKLFFGAKSAAKSAGRQAEEKGREAGEELKNKSQIYYDKAKQRMEELDEEYRPKAKKAVDDARSFAEELVNEAWSDKKAEKPEAEKPEEEQDQEGASQKATDYSETFSGKNPYEFGEDTGKKTADSQEKSRFDEASEEFYRLAGEAGQKAQDLSERVGEQVLRKSDAINARLSEEGAKAWEKAQEVGGKFKKRFDELVEKANQEAAKEQSMEDLSKEAQATEDELEQRVKERAKRSNAENLRRDEKEGPLGGFDSFFDKAERYAEGDYHNEGGKDMNIGQDPDYKPKENKGRVKGFEDRDGDGDEIIDDAILDEEDDKKGPKDEKKGS
jgi:ElaB/YqjD/DUF883 family membrane-anchored ribosome-binding protein